MCVQNLVPIGPQAMTCIPSEGYTHTHTHTDTHTLSYIDIDVFSILLLLFIYTFYCNTYMYYLQLHSIVRIIIELN